MRTHQAPPGYTCSVLKLDIEIAVRIVKGNTHARAGHRELLQAAARARGASARRAAFELAVGNPDKVCCCAFGLGTGTAVSLSCICTRACHACIRIGLRCNSCPCSLPPCYLHQGMLSAEETARRVAQFRRVGLPLLVTRASLFTNKARLLPGACFVVGWDTAIRLVMPKYYDGSETNMLLQFER